MSFHVTYGDRGWNDPSKRYKDSFASARYDQRHKRIAKGARVTVPQFVIDGRFITPSSATIMPELRKREVRTAIDEALKLKARIGIESQAKLRDRSVNIVVRLRQIGNESLADSLRVIPVLFLRETRASPQAGWNAGRTLHDWFVVCGIHKPLKLAPALLVDGTRISINAPKGEPAANLGVAIIVQDVKTQEIIESRAFPVEVG